MSRMESQLSAQERISLLSRREKDVLVLLAQGFCVKDIANVLSIAAGTVGIHLSRIYEKLGVNKAVLAVRYAIRGGLVAA